MKLLEGHYIIPTITETEEKWLKIIKPVAIEGDTSVQESFVVDVFDNEDARVGLVIILVQ